MAKEEDDLTVREEPKAYRIGHHLTLNIHLVVFFLLGFMRFLIFGLYTDFPRIRTTVGSSETLKLAFSDFGRWAVSSAIQFFLYLLCFTPIHVLENGRTSFRIWSLCVILSLARCLAIEDWFSVPASMDSRILRSVISNVGFGTTRLLSESTQLRVLNVVADVILASISIGVSTLAGALLERGLGSKGRLTEVSGEENERPIGSSTREQ